MFDSRTRLQLLSITLIALKISLLRVKVYHKDAYRDAYEGIFYMEKLTFGEPFQNLRKGGVWYVRVTIPKEHREIYFGQGKATKQKVYSLFSKNMHEALANLPTVKSKAIEEYRNKLKEHDPLVLSAEKLMESLFARYDENNIVVPTDKWFDVFSKNSLDYNELQGLRNYEDKKEFHRLLSLLRMEVSKLMVVHEDLRDAN